MFVGTIYSILPPSIAIIIVLLTRKVLFSLAVGIVTCALLLENFSLIGTVVSIGQAVKGIFIEEGLLHTGNVFILLFLLLLGILAALITVSGGTRAFGEWALTRVKSRVGAQLLTACLGIIIFIDDYFNALAVGQVSRPITDQHRVSRAKLAYLIDSTSAPICVVSPISSWGAYIIGLIGTILATHQLTHLNAFSAFMLMIPMNFYVITSILFVFITAIFNINLQTMKKHEQRALQTGETINRDKGRIPGELKEDLPTSKQGTPKNLILPIVALFIGTVGAMLYTGNQAVEGPFDILAVLENTDVASSLLLGGLVSVGVAMLIFWNQFSVKNALPKNSFRLAVQQGIQSMLPAIYILLFAWTIVDLISQLQTGEYLASVVETSNVPVGFIPALIFIIAGVMAFSTGTSWGTFGLMLPIAAQIIVSIDVNLLLPSLAAVLAGAVFGDHCSPISDTTILSSTGAGCHHIDHVLTQLPYAILCAIISVIGYLTIGFTGNVILSLSLTILLFLIVTVVVLRQTRQK